MHFDPRARGKGLHPLSTLRNPNLQGTPPGLKSDVPSSTVSSSSVMRLDATQGWSRG